MRLPPQAQRVFKGIIFDVYQWKQKMFDKSVETFEMLKRPDTILIIPVISNKIVIAHEEQPVKGVFHSLFGGRCEEGEDALVTAKRELLEEAGLESNDWELLKVYEPYTKIEWRIHLFVARNCVKVAEQKLDAGERITSEALSFNQFVTFVESDTFYGNDFQLDIFKMRRDKKLDELKEK